MVFHKDQTLSERVFLSEKNYFWHIFIFKYLFCV